MFVTLILIGILNVQENAATEHFSGKIPDRVGEWIRGDDWHLFEVENSEKGSRNVTESMFFRVPDLYFVDKIRLRFCGELRKITIATSKHDVVPDDLLRNNLTRDDWERWEIKSYRLVSDTMHEYRGLWRQTPLWRLDITSADESNHGERCSYKISFYARAGMLALWNAVSLFQANANGDVSPRRTKRAAVEAPLSNRCRKVTKIPQRMVARYKVDTQFYFKYTSAYGIPVMASKFVNNRALQRACYVIRVMLAETKDIRDHLFANRGRLTVIARNQTIPMVPEMTSYSSWSGRALAGTLENPVTVVPEEHLLCGIDKYSRIQDLLVHEIAHAVHAIASRTAFPNLDFWISEAYQKAKTMGLWSNTYAITSHFEYFAEGVQAYFNRQREGREGGDGIQNQINTNKELKRYDSTLHRIIKWIFPCRNHIIPRCKDLSQGKGLNQVVRMDCKSENVAPPVRGACTNDRWSCTYWAHIGECANNPSFMSIYCRHSCKICHRTSGGTTATSTGATQDHEFTSKTSTMVPVSTTRPCGDGHQGCPTWKSYCQTLPHIRELCRLSCGICMTPTQGYTRPTGTISTLPHTTTHTSMNCVDEHAGCVNWKSYCSSLPHIRDACRRSCMICQTTQIPLTNPGTQIRSTTTASETKCKDRGKNCRKLITRCEKPNIMKRCPRTCRTCSQSHVTEDSALTNQTFEIDETDNDVNDGSESSCVDKKRNCKSRTHLCHKPSVKKSCPFTCNVGLCSGRNSSTGTARGESKLENTTMVSCTDSNSHCRSWVSRCTNNMYVARNCRRTCDFCSSQTDVREITTEASQQDDCVCRDIDPACSSWTSHCRSHRYVKSHCKRTCHLCDTEAVQNCRRAKRNK